MDKRVSRFDFFRVGGGVLLAWAVANTYVSATRYGVDQGMYFWFCNLAMIGVGLGLWFRHRGWLLAFLSIASFTQTFWIVDNLWRISTGANLIGLVEFMYQPGNPMDEFLLSHYHFFILPTGILGLLLLRERRDAPWWAVAAVNAFIFGMSYFVFPKSQNLNCIHEPCVPSLESWGGPVYSILFFLFVCAGCLSISALARRTLDKWHLPDLARRYAVALYVAVCALAVATTLVDIHVKRGIPSFSCAAPTEVGGVRIGCKFTLEQDIQVLSFVYTVDSRAAEQKSCRTFLEHDGKRELLSENVVVGPGERKDVKTELAYPRETTVARLTAECLTQAKTPTVSLGN